MIHLSPCRRHLPALLALLVALAGAAALPLESARAASDGAFEPAYQQFTRALSGDKSAVDGAADAFDALLRAEPASPVLMAYAGASTAMKAGTTMMPWKKMGYAEDGLAQLDKALTLLGAEHDTPLQHGVPGVLETRFVAASTFLAVPDFMNRGARGAKLLDQVLASPLLASAPLPFKGQVWMRAAKLAGAEKRPADQRRWLEQVVASGAPQAEAARAALKDLAP